MPLAPPRIGHIPAAAHARAQPPKSHTHPGPGDARGCLRGCLRPAFAPAAGRRGGEPRRGEPPVSRCVIVSLSRLTALCGPIRADARGDTSGETTLRDQSGPHAREAGSVWESSQSQRYKRRQPGITGQNTHHSERDRVF
jgi:hypothetical protein